MQLKGKDRFGFSMLATQDLAQFYRQYCEMGQPMPVAVAIGLHPIELLASAIHTERDEIELAGARERQSSSGVIIATGTGATGWARSIMTGTHQSVSLQPADPRLGVFVREPWPSLATGASITCGPVDAGAPLVITSQMNEGGVIFADGLEQDRLEFGWGRRVAVTVSDQTLNLVRAG
jgi:hypothetical protein